MMKSYVTVVDPPAWRGRLLVSDTIKRHRARNVRYKNEFDFKTLSYSGPENVALKHGVDIVRAWLVANDRKNAAIARADLVLKRMSGVPDHAGDIGALVRAIGRSAGRLPSHYSYYQDPLWTAYLLLQSKLPDLSADGFVTLDSLIVDLSKVFEAFIRTVLSERAGEKGWRIVDGNDKPYPFFTDNSKYSVHPDIVVVKDGVPVALLDVKYKPEPKESDRYEVLSFMDTTGIARGGFVCPLGPGGTSRYMGSTVGGKRFSVLRFDLAAADIEVEASRFADNVEKLVNGVEGFA
jgi:5-methylcytosine-specific restriction enzyme subunit McrC